MRTLTYVEAINEALIQEMKNDSSVFVYGLGVPDHTRVFGTTNKLVELFPGRCLDMPLSEDALMGFGIGAALNGLRPVNIHIRVDFLLLAMNQLVNMASTHRYINGKGVPLVIRAIVGRGWGQGCHHSKSLHSYFAHIPGLRVVMPTTPYDVKGMLISAIRCNDPVLVLEHRWLYWSEGDVPEGHYTTSLSGDAIVHKGDDVTIIATSWLVIEALFAAKILEERGISAEVIDVRSALPLGLDNAKKSAEQTGYCVVADNDWIPCGLGAEIAHQIGYACFDWLQMPVERVGFKFSPTPTARHMENKFYPNAEDIIRKIEYVLNLPKMDLEGKEFFTHEKHFRGPF